MAEKIVSPGVFTRENDLSFVQQGVGAIGAAIVGPTVKGPALIPQQVFSYSDFQALFGDSFKSGSDYYQYFTSICAKEYLKHVGPLTVVRVLGTGYSKATASAHVRNTTTAGVAPSGRDFHIFGMRNDNAGIYGAIIQRNNGGRSTNYNTAMWGYDANWTSGDVYNCVVEEVNGNYNMSHVYDNTGGGNRYMERSTMIGGMGTAYTCGAAVANNIPLTSSAHNFCGNTNNAKTSINYCTSPSVFPYYITNNTSDNSTYGVYGGTYAWTP